MGAIPPEFGEDFLAWLKDATEKAWSVYAPRDFGGPGAPGGLDWRRGTRWADPLTEAELLALERGRGLPFPPEHRLFLARLHATDLPRAGFLYRGAKKEPAEAPGFWDWRRDGREMRAALARVRRGLASDVRGGLWLEAWGPRPPDAGAAAALARRACAAAPRLIPLFGHRFLVQAPAAGPRPVLSIVGSDVVVYGADLRRYLLLEFAGLLGLDADARRSADSARPPAREIPFWGGLAG
jgi:hypothetical protein